MDLLRDLRLGEFDVLVGINLLREGLDLPEVSLVAILDADKEGFLRSETSLIQTIGRAARNVRGKVVLYADEVTDSMRRAIQETERRRRIQLEYNRKHGITPQTVQKAVQEFMPELRQGQEKPEKAPKRARKPALGIKEPVSTGKGKEPLSSKELVKLIKQLEAEMFEAARRLEFERAAQLRDEIQELRQRLLGLPS